MIVTVLSTCNSKKIDVFLTSTKWHGLEKGHLFQAKVVTYE